MLALLVVAPAAVAAGNPWRTYTVGEAGAAFAAPASPDLALTADTHPSITLALKQLWALTADSPGYQVLNQAVPSPPDPRSLQVLRDGDILVCDRTHKAVAEFSPTGALVWSYSSRDDPDMLWPFSAQRLDDGNTLIADRSAKRVIVVTPDKRIVWQYGTTGQAGGGPNHLDDAFYAVRIDDANRSDGNTTDGNVLICDSKQAGDGGYRVIEVRFGDYEPSQPDNGFTKSIVWQYGETGVKGDGPGQLRSAHSVQRLTNGDTLITDAFGDRVIEVTPDKRIVWQYGVTKTPEITDDDHPGPLANLNYAVRLENGHTLIADTDHERLVEVDHMGGMVASYDLTKVVGQTVPPQTSPDPRAAVRLPDGSTMVAEPGYGQVVQIGRALSAAYLSATLLGDLPFRKVFHSLTYDATTPSGTKVRLEYRIGGGRWHTLPRGGGSIPYTRDAFGTTIEFRASLSTGDRSLTPVLSGVSIKYRQWIPGDTRRVARTAAEQKADKTTPRPASTPAQTWTPSGGGSGSGGAGGGVAGGGGTGGSSGGTPNNGAASAGMPVPALATPQTAALPADGSQSVSGIRVASSQFGAGSSFGRAGSAGASGETRNAADLAATRDLRGVALVAALIAALAVSPALLARRRLRHLLRFAHPAPESVDWVSMDDDRGRSRGRLLARFRR